MAFYRLEPFGQEVQDVRTALICQTIANCFIKRENGEPFSINDFMLDWTGEKTAQPITPEDMLAKAKLMTSMMTAMQSTKQNG